MATKQSYGLDATLNIPFDAAVERTKAALKAEGFGVLTEIDVQATLKQKIGAEFERYLILGACHPHLAYRGLQAEHDPAAMLGIVENPALQVVADEARQRLQRVVAALGALEDA